MAKLRLSSSLRRLLHEPAEVLLVEGESVAACLAALVMREPALKPYVYAEDGVAVNPFISVYLNGQDVRFLAPEALQVNATDEIEVIASLAGG